jgi:ubiquinone/menaquinone biosynthesis C-methylase UbiE
LIDYDKIASDYARFRQVHPEVLKGLLTEGCLKASSRVLEVGCGTGNYIGAIAKQLGCRSYGIDPSEKMLSEARRKTGVKVRLGTGERLRFRAAFFDLVFTVDVVHHLSDRKAYFREAYRVTKPGGKICTVTDSEWVIRHRMPLSFYFPETVEKELARYPSIHELRDLMEKSGFVRISENMVEFPYELTDAEPYRNKVFSALQLIPQEAFRQGTAHMKRDLKDGPIRCVSRYTLLWGSRRCA